MLIDQVPMYQVPMYRVVDEQNHPVFESKNYFQALQEAELLNNSNDDHYFFVEKVAVLRH
jgi:hypothetical protein